MVFFREASEDIYSGFEHQSAEGVYEAVKVTTRAACERMTRAEWETWKAAEGRVEVSKGDIHRWTRKPRRKPSMRECAERAKREQRGWTP